MISTNLKLSDLFGGSIWLHFLFERCGRWLTVPGACALWAVVQAGPFVALAWTQQTLWPTGQAGELPLMEDTSALAYYFLLPLCFALLYWSLILFRRYLNRLDEVLEPGSPHDAEERLHDIARDHFAPGGIRKVWAVFVLVGLLVFVFNTVANLLPDVFYLRANKWDGIAFPVSFAVSRLYVLVIWAYVIPTWATAVYTQLRVMIHVNGVMAKSGWLKVSPYALDQFGGLGKLATAASWVGYLLIAAGTFFLAPLLRLAWGGHLHAGNYIGVGVYVVFASVGLFLPTILLHRIMARKRAHMLGFLSDAFDDINRRVDALVKGNDLRGLSDDDMSRALQTVDLLHKQWDALPSWPMSLATVARLLAAVVAPAAALLAKQLSDAVPQ